MVSKSFDYKSFESRFDYPRAAAMTIRTVLLSLQALLATPEPDDPQDAGNKITKLFQLVFISIHCFSCG